MPTPIETVYKGYRFRSRLEARWAVFFDVLRWTWEYEREGYDLGLAGWYLPDFWVKPQEEACWIEIKPVMPTEQECAKCAALCEATRLEVFLFSGVPGDEVIQAWQWSETEVRVIHEQWEGSLFQDTQSKGYANAKYVLMFAINAARSARFEHGAWRGQ